MKIYMADLEGNNMKDKILLKLKSINNNTANVSDDVIHAGLRTLGISRIELGGIAPNPLVYNEFEYFPVTLLFTTPDYALIGMSGNSISYNFLYVKEAKRVSMDKVVEKILEILKAEYPGSYEVLLGRYLFKFQNLDLRFINGWKKLIKVDKEPIIDYTWLAPLQELSYYNQEKAKKPSKTKRGLLANVLLRKDELGEEAEIGEVVTQNNVDHIGIEHGYDPYISTFAKRHNITSAEKLQQIQEIVIKGREARKGKIVANKQVSPIYSYVKHKSLEDAAKEYGIDIPNRYKDPDYKVIDPLRKDWYDAQAMLEDAVFFGGWGLIPGSAGQTNIQLDKTTPEEPKSGT